MQSNLASKREYNFERFEQTQQAPKIERLPRREKLPHPAKILSVALIMLAVVFASLYGRVQIAELGAQINEKTAYLEELTSERVRMEAELDGKMSLSAVEQIATEELGMVKPDSSQVTYLQVQQNRVETAVEEDTLLDKILAFLEKFGIVPD